jgi:hypothetical protein
MLDVDLSEPSLQGLSHILRHRESWPEGFKWDYRDHEQCAMGLTLAFWKIKIDEDMSIMEFDFEKLFGITPRQFDAIFFAVNDRLDIFMVDVWPEMVADEIDNILAVMSP